jgi:hypothetical protein
MPPRMIFKWRHMNRIRSNVSVRVMHAVAELDFVMDWSYERTGKGTDAA